MPRLALGLEYDGRLNCGWQSQPNGCGVQDKLESALAQIAGEPVRVIVAGRTDTGVHAQGQVVHFDTGVQRPDSAWVRGVNAHLPSHIAVQWAQPVGEEFHARFSALSRSYRYLLLNRPHRPGSLHGRVGWFHLPLNLPAMRTAAAHLVGEHDFSAFRAAECQAKSPVRQLRRLDIRQEGDLVVFELTANGFLHHMVRNIVGNLVYVGKGRYPPEWLAELRESRDRTLAAPTFAPDGLYLFAVEYAPEWNVPTTKSISPCLPE